MKQKVITKVLNVSEKTKNMMIEYFNDYKREKTPPYAIFQADDGGTVVTLYNSGKCVFQGFDADLSSLFWIETEKINSGSAQVTSSSDKKNEEKKERRLPLRISSIGSDEVGTGDYFGPMVVTASYVSKDDIDFLLELKVKDSKKLTDNDILKIVPKIIERIKYNTIVVHNNEYNDYYKKNINMNQMKAILHNKALLYFTDNNYQYDKIVIDQFEPPKSFYNHIKDAPKKISNVTFLTKAEDECLSVAVSSMISRYAFLKEMNKLEQEYGVTFPKGAGDIVDKTGKELVAKYGKDILYKVSKLNFKNTTKILQ